MSRVSNEENVEKFHAPGNRHSSGELYNKAVKVGPELFCDMRKLFLLNIYNNLNFSRLKTKMSPRRPFDD